MKQFIEKILPSFSDAITLDVENYQFEKLWYSIIQFDSMRLGITANGDWIIDCKSKQNVLDGQNSFIHALILLEIPIEQLVEHLLSFCKTYDCGNENDIYDMFPFYETVKMGLESPSVYWIEHAVKWYLKLPNHHKKKLLDTIENVYSNKQVSQKVRQIVRVELRNLNDSV